MLLVCIFPASTVQVLGFQARATTPGLFCCFSIRKKCEEFGEPGSWQLPFLGKGFESAQQYNHFPCIQKFVWINENRLFQSTVPQGWALVGVILRFLTHVSFCRLWARVAHLPNCGEWAARAAVVSWCEQEVSQLRAETAPWPRTPGELLVLAVVHGGTWGWKWLPGTRTDPGHRWTWGWRLLGMSKAGEDSPLLWGLSHFPPPRCYLGGAKTWTESRVSPAFCGGFSPVLLVQTPLGSVKPFGGMSFPSPINPQKGKKPRFRLHGHQLVSG